MLIFRGAPRRDLLGNGGLTSKVHPQIFSGNDFLGWEENVSQRLGTNIISHRNGKFGKSPKMLAGKGGYVSLSH